MAAARSLSAVTSGALGDDGASDVPYVCSNVIQKPTEFKNDGLRS